MCGGKAAYSRTRDIRTWSTASSLVLTGNGSCPPAKMAPQRSPPSLSSLSSHFHVCSLTIDDITNSFHVQLPYTPRSPCESVCREGSVQSNYTKLEWPLHTLFSPHWSCSIWFQNATILWMRALLLNFTHRRVCMILSSWVSHKSLTWQMLYILTSFIKHQYCRCVILSTIGLSHFLQLCHSVVGLERGKNGDRVQDPQCGGDVGPVPPKRVPPGQRGRRPDGHRLGPRETGASVGVWSGVDARQESPVWLWRISVADWSPGLPPGEDHCMIQLVHGMDTDAGWQSALVECGSIAAKLKDVPKSGTLLHSFAGPYFSIFSNISKLCPSVLTHSL